MKGSFDRFKAEVGQTEDAIGPGACDNEVAGSGASSLNMTSTQATMKHKNIFTSIMHMEGNR